jgi:hypothetical protein
MTTLYVKIYREIVNTMFTIDNSLIVCVDDIFKIIDVVNTDDIEKNHYVTYEIYIHHNDKIHKIETYRKPVLLPSNYVLE